MDSFIERVKQSFKWKKSSEYSAEKLGITVDDYEKLKSWIKSTDTVEGGNSSYEYNLEKGEAKLEAVCSSEPKTPEEIIDLLKIDTTQWKLSSYWNKQMGDHWRVSAMVTKLKADEISDIKELLKNFKPKTFKIPKRIKTPGKTKNSWSFVFTGYTFW